MMAKNTPSKSVAVAIDRIGARAFNLAGQVKTQTTAVSLARTSHM
jgi:hypothetical protein